MKASMFGIGLRVTVVFTAILVIALLVSGFGGAGTTRLRGRIVFSASPTGIANQDIYVVNADGSHRHQLTHDSSLEESPDWSPDGRSIVYVRGPLYRMAANGGNPHVFFAEKQSSQLRIGSPDWSPDGRKVAFSTLRGPEGNVWSYSLNHTLTQITHDSSSGDPSWSPDGKRIAYTHVNSPEHATIFVGGANGSDGRDVSHAPVDDAFPAWSPNGKWIALRSLNADWQQHESDSLVIVNPAGTVRQTLLTGGAIFPADWSPTSDTILFLWVADPERGIASPRQLYTISLNGGTPRPVAGTQGAVTTASWHR